jgi:IPT/TIG domain
MRAAWRRREAGRHDETASLGYGQARYPAIDRLRASVPTLTRALVLGALISLVFVASAQACPVPETGLLSGEFDGPYDHGDWYAFPTFSPETSEIATIEGTAHAEGYSKLGLGNFDLNGDYYHGTLNTCTGEETFEIPWSGVLYGNPVANFLTTYQGAVTTTSETGFYEDTYDGAPETGTWWTIAYPSQPSQGTLAGQVGIIPPAGTQASSFEAAPVNPSQLPPGVVAPVGALAFSVKEVPANGTISVTLILPSGSEPTEVYKSANGVYEPYPAAKTKVNGNEITLELTDNELPWDENAEAGVIDDPVVPVEPQVGTPPTITRLSPRKAGAKAPVTITGTGFHDVTVVRFGSTEAASFQVLSPTTIRAITPSGATGKLRVSVANHGGVSASTKKDLFTFKKVKKPKK